MPPATPTHGKTTAPLPPRLARLFGGEDLEVETLAGDKIIVRVAHVPLRHLPTFIELYQNTAELVDFVTHVDGKPVEPGWADSLTDASQRLIHEKAEALNLERALVEARAEINASHKARRPIMELTVLKTMELIESALKRPSSSASPATKS
jgi:hypothetical protein